jgi:hypothetical protein
LENEEARKRSEKRVELRRGKDKRSNYQRLEEKKERNEVNIFFIQLNFK